MKKRIATWAILILAFFGLADSVYLLQHEISGVPLVCDSSLLTGCNAVAQSPYSELFGIPIAAYGTIFYALLFVVAALELVIFHHRARRIIQAFAVVGFGASTYFTILQLFVINALCIYCIASAVTALAIFLFAFLLEPIRSKQPQKPQSTAPRAPMHPYLSMPPS